MKIPVKSERMSEIIVRFSHHHESTFKPYTFAIVTFEEKDGTERTTTGEAHLHPNDQYDKRIGRKIALAQALKRSGLTREERRQVWEGLFARGMKK